MLAIRGIDGSAWDPPGDFIFIAILLVGAGVAYEVAARVADRRAYGAGVGLVAQALAFVIALVAGLGFTGPITVFFAALWLISGWLFRKAAREQSSVGKPVKPQVVPGTRVL